MERLSEVLPKLTRLQDSITSNEKPSGIRPSLGVPGVDLPPNEPHCPKCLDGGWLRLTHTVGHPDFGRLVPCQCRIKQLQAGYRERILRWSNMPEAMAGWTFDTWQKRADLAQVNKACMAYAQGPE